MRVAEPSDAELLSYCSSVTPPYPAQLEAIRKAIAEPLQKFQLSEG